MTTNDSERRRAGHMRRLNYENAKQKLLLLEESNYTHVFVIMTQDGWYKILSHSALIFLHFVFPIARDKLNLTSKPPRLIADSDFRYKSPIGVLNSKELAVFEKPILASGAKKVKVQGSNSDNIIAYKLEHEITEAEFWEIKEKEDDLWSQANTIITPKAVYPILAMDIKEASKAIYFVARKMQSVDREFFGEDMLRLVKGLAKDIIMAEREYLPWEMFFETTPGVVSELLANVSLLSDFRLIDKKVLIRMNDALISIEKDLKTARKDYEKRRRGKVTRNS